MNAASKIHAGTTRIRILDEPIPPADDDQDDAPAAFTSFRLDDLPDEAQAEIVQRLYGQGHVIAFVGAPNAGKTALAVDHLIHVAASE